jgi:hypothetical protein
MALAAYVGLLDSFEPRVGILNGGSFSPAVDAI